MLTLTLEPTDDRASPAFRDADGCARWLAQLQLTNLHAAHGTLRAQLDEFNRYPMRGLERLHTLELLRETVASVQADYAKKLIAKKLPLSAEELTVFVAINGLWQGMVTGYQRCLQACIAGDAQLAPFAALLCQRCLLFCGSQIFEYLCAGYEFDGRLWRQLHALYGFSEERGLQLEKAPGAIGGDSHATTCRATYVKLLLACHAYRAHLTRGQLRLLDRWLTQWSADIGVNRSFTHSRGDAPPLAVDLESRLGLQPARDVGESDSVRYLAMMPLSKLLRVKTILLQQGQSPQQLELGDGCNREDCIELLNYLHQSWCEGRGASPSGQRGENRQAQMCYGIESCYAHIASKPFKQPSKNEGMDTISRKQIESFGRVLSDTDRHNLAEVGYTLETWQVREESLLGADLLRVEIAGVRLAPGQLVAVRSDASKAFALGATNWVSVAQTGQLHIGVRYFPGIPEIIAMKATGISRSAPDKYVAALLLPAMDALRIPPSLIAPRDWFKPGRVVEIITANGKSQNVRMEFSVEKGQDYERISFKQAS